MIQVTDIHKSYGSLHVLRGVSLVIPDHQVAAIVGPSGAGKSTLLHIIGTLDRPDSGQVIYDGVDVSMLSDRRISRFRNKHIGFVFQAHQLLPEFTLLENVMMPALIAGMTPSRAAEMAMPLLREVGLGDRLGHKPTELSGGEAQRGAVARALVNSPSVVLADEPSGSLDSRNRRDLQDIFFRLRDLHGTTFVTVTHDESLASRCDSIFRITDGEISPCAI